MAEKRLKLAEGRTVPLEDGQPWPVDGASVELTLYVRRRIADGDLVDADPEKPAAVPEVPVAAEPREIEENPGRKNGKGDK